MSCKLIPVLVSYKSEKVEQYINLDSICSISPYIEIDMFDNYCESDSLTEITFNNGNFLIVISSYQDFIRRLSEIGFKSQKLKELD